MNQFIEQILRPIAHSFEQFADRNALCIAGTFYTYKDLSLRTSAIRQSIIEQNAEDEIIALAVHDDIDTYATIIALWMEGKAYVPLHPQQPMERNMNIINQLDAHYVIDSDSNSKYQQWGLSVINHLINTKQSTSTTGASSPWKNVQDSKLAYVLFTSGSTGTPKGVMINRQNIGSFIESFWETGISINENDKCLQAFDLTFDVSVQSYLVALTRGSCLYTVPYGSVKYIYVASLIQEEHITFGAMAPSMLTYLRPYFEELDAISLKNCILTAEACPIDLLDDWHNCAKNADIYDFYGPTEATIYCTYYKWNPNGDCLCENGIVSIGKPLSNVAYQIIDEEGHAVKNGEKGELCIAGPQVTPGYWKNEQKNKDCFFVKEMDGQAMRFYRTGDLCHLHPSGNILYCGRLDQQAKIQGFRVELGEIEYHAREYYQNKRRAVAMAYQNNASITEIALIVEGTEASTDSLIAHLRSKMPHYMIPSKVMFIESFPLNASEKIDKVKLKSEMMKSV